MTQSIALQKQGNTGPPRLPAVAGRERANGDPGAASHGSIPNRHRSADLWQAAADRSSIRFLFA